MCGFLSRSIFNVGKNLYKYSYILTNQIIHVRRIELTKLYSDDCKSNKFPDAKITEEKPEHNLPINVRIDYQEFRDEDAEIIFDVDEEKKKIDLETINALQQETDPYKDLDQTHGVNGVFDIEDLVEILRRDKAQNIFVATIPEQLSYVDYIVIVTGKSPRHLIALATYIRKAYKLKKYPHEIIPKIEGKKSSEWVAIDLGNIALHLFSPAGRDKYDLETLWSVGSNYDTLLNSFHHDEYNNQLEEYLAGLQPADDLESCEKPV